MWKGALSGEIFFISDDTYQEAGIIRGVVISRVTTAGSKNDIILKEENYVGLFPSNRVVFRITEISILTEDLSVFYGNVTDEDKGRILNSLKIPLQKDEYDEFKEAAIREIIEKISKERLHAFSVFCIPE